ncbi:MAG: hypothetical protein KC476_04115 [Cyanobacteria bacterium HKST-UBA06]|nr:hypothetical protein [Cyanobacteria bacterium HKST-UBA04]MCA9807120.1 hypothetical protein [Cyanobacteria bacterium HKST-UBA06]MCA9841397.1 hypothetical protein [Cyanobacteria bacterium HKST-UBA03]
MFNITQIASDLNEKVDNKYALVLEIADLAKRLLEDARQQADDYLGMGGGSAIIGGSGTSSDTVIYQSLVMKASEIDIDDNLIG